MGLLSETRVLNACHVLFGEGVRLDRDFLFYLQPSGAKAAYRRRAKEVHPDLLERATPELRRRRAELFRQLVEAHDLMNEFFQQRETGQWGGRQHSASASHRAHKRQPAPAARTARAPEDAQAGQFFTGEVPAIHLNIGRYCYFRGVIPYAVLIEAVSWQRRQRPAIGEIARRWGWLSEDALRKVVRSRGLLGRFGERAVQLGFLAPAQVQSLLYYQRSQQQRLGHYFVERGYVNSEEMDRLARDLQLHNAKVHAAAR